MNSSDDAISLLLGLDLEEDPSNTSLQNSTDDLLAGPLFFELIPIADKFTIVYLTLNVNLFLYMTVTEKFAEFRVFHDYCVLACLSNCAALFHSILVMSSEKQPDDLLVVYKVWMGLQYFALNMIAVQLMFMCFDEVQKKKYTLLMRFLKWIISALLLGLQFFFDLFGRSHNFVIGACSLKLDIMCLTSYVLIIASLITWCVGEKCSKRNIPLSAQQTAHLLNSSIYAFLLTVGLTGKILNQVIFWQPHGPSPTTLVVSLPVHFAYLVPVTWPFAFYTCNLEWLKKYVNRPRKASVQCVQQTPVRRDRGGLIERTVSQITITLD
ncbi:unnamed protein product [Caenorhabditis sp. 36 PRJEB53466]|nr:unnamed protein product [Caenorhabditis sp. 36 PRJEB53466]